MNRSYVIFICTFDPFGEGLYRYTFENLCKEQKDISLNDEAVKLFFNTTGTKGEVTGEARAFLKYVGGMASEDAYIKELQEKIEAAKRNEEWRREYMTLLMRDKENIEKGITEERVRMVKSLLQMGTIPEKSIAFAAKMSLEELQQIKKSLKKDN